MFDHAPGWDTVRVPERLMTLTTLGLALLAGAGAAAVVRRAPHVRMGALLVALMVGGVLAEGSAFRRAEDGSLWPPRGPEQPTVPSAPAALRGLPDPLLHLPAETGERSSPLFLLWSSDGFPKVVNGLGSIQPDEYTRVQQVTRSFPDRRSIGVLRSMGVRTVVLHPDLATGTDWAGVAARPVSGLPLRRRERGGLLVYDLRAGPAP
jgi:hypothetical protein